MSYHIILPLLSELRIPHRLLQTVAQYLLSLMIPSDKHTQSFAARITGRASSIFSNLLGKHLGLSRQTLNRAARRRLRYLAKKRAPLCKKAPWTIAIIIDSTLHSRASSKAQNAQKFNHGSGWVFGHQWTNVGIYLAGQYVPLAPIPFYTRQECKRRGIAYVSENDKVARYLKNISLRGILGDHCCEEVVVLADSGYDCKQIHRAILLRKWDFIMGVKQDRRISIEPEQWHRISDFFSDGRRRPTTVRLQVNGTKKWRNYAIKQREGHIKGLTSLVKLVSSRKTGHKAKCFVCSNNTVDGKEIIDVYRRRWEIEIFHRDIKSQLGLEDCAPHSFDPLHAHVHWVYTAYIFLKEMTDAKTGIKEAQLILEAKIRIRELNATIRKTTHFKGARAIQG